MTSITNLQRKFDKLLFFYLFIRVGNFSQLFTNLITHKLTNLKTHHLVNLKTHEPNNSPPHNLKRLQYILQNTYRPSLYSSEKRPQKQANWHNFQPFTFLFLSIFKTIACILHRFAFLVWLPTRIFQPPNTHFLSLKS